jgi:hypothetical protein
VTALLDAARSGFSACLFNIGRQLFRVSARPPSPLEAIVTATHSALPDAVLTAISAETPVIRAYREHLSYTIDDIAITSGLTVEEVEKIESGHRYDKGYRDRIARALGLPEGIFDEISEIPDAA